MAASRGPGAAHDALLKFRNFLDKPGTLGISAKPSRSVPLSGIIDERATASFDDLVVKLGLSFEQN